MLLISLPAPAQAQDEPICTDRPTKANATCTVPAGMFQLEAAPFGWSRIDSGPARADLVLIGASTLKLGLSDRSDLQLGFVPYARITSGEGGSRTRVSGTGDLTMRYKHRLTGDGDTLQLALIPFAKLPTAATGLGNGEVEGGLAVPVSLSLTGPVTLTLGPELDLLADADGAGHHLNLVSLINVSASVAPRFAVIAELWAAWNFDPAGTVEQVSFDAAATYAPTSRLQLDAGVNFGLNGQTPDVELYVGSSVRF